MRVLGLLYCLGFSVAFWQAVFTDNPTTAKPNFHLLFQPFRKAPSTLFLLFLHTDCCCVVTPVDTCVVLERA